MMSHLSSRRLLLAVLVLSVPTLAADNLGSVSEPLVFPIDRALLSIASNGGRVAGGPGEKLAYRSTEGRVAVSLSPNVQLADDLTLTVAPQCPLRRFWFETVGKVNPDGCGGIEGDCGPYRVDFSLYTQCPLSAGAQRIEGTVGCAATGGAEGCIPIPDNGPVRIEVVIPEETVIPLPPRVWLGVRFDRENAGVVVGAPALSGFSDDRLDIIGAPCNSNLGGFPNNPYAGFNAAVYTDASCSDAQLAYQNILASGPGLETNDRLLADDFVLDRQCDMVSMEVGTFHGALYDVELRRTFAGAPAGTSAFGESNIAGTYKRFLTSGDGGSIRRFVFDPPVPLPAERLWVVLASSSGGGALQTQHKPSVGVSTSYWSAWSDEDQQWIVYASHTFDVSFHVVITCTGAAPLGACCDQYFRDDNDDAVCRDVARINCPFPLNGGASVPPWEEGVPCRKCQGGDNDGAACDDDTMCPAGACLDNDPFQLPCGYSACCVDGACENATKNDCPRVGSPYATHSWLRGRFCGIDGQQCPQIGGCLGSTSCFEASPRTCRGGPTHGAPCLADADCSGGNDGVCRHRAGLPWVCEGGVRDGIACRIDRDCLEAHCLAPSGCEDLSCCSTVCRPNPNLSMPPEHCCEIEWDQDCVDLALSLCDVCPPATVTWLDPPCGVIDARRPFPSDQPAQLEGIDTLVAAAPPGAIPQCWRATETPQAPDRVPLYPEGVAELAIVGVHDDAAGAYTLTLNRPIAPGTVADIRYAGSLQGRFAALPGDVGGDGSSNSADILDLIDMLNGVLAPPWGLYSTDIDRSGKATPADVVELIDLLNGAGAFVPWNNVEFPDRADTQCPD